VFSYHPLLPLLPPLPLRGMERLPFRDSAQ
jgi:hypothetical protein